MGRLKRFEKAKERSRKEGGIGLRMPLMCAATGCSSETEIGWVGSGPYPAALIFQAGWMARADPNDGIIRFYCPKCWPTWKDVPLGIEDEGFELPNTE